MFNPVRKQGIAAATRRSFQVESLESRRLLASTISGVVFNDANLDGVQQSSEKGIAKQTIFVDLNFDGRQQFNEPTATTNSKGEYGFSGAGAGVYRLILLKPAGYRQTNKGLSYFDVSVSGFGDNHPGNNFGLSTTGEIHGTVFNDSNRDGVQQVTEFGVSNITIFLDKNGNGRYDKGEKRLKTDGVGSWSFNGLSPGKYKVRIVVPKGSAITAGQSSVQKITLTAGLVAPANSWGLR